MFISSSCFDKWHVVTNPHVASSDAVTAFSFCYVIYKIEVARPINVSVKHAGTGVYILTF